MVGGRRAKVRMMSETIMIVNALVMSVNRVVALVREVRSGRVKLTVDAQVEL